MVVEDEDKMGEIMICRNCGKEFEPKKRGRKNTGFCCKSCADKWRKKNVYANQPKKYEKTCEYCGEIFTTNNESQKYCSTDCAHASRRGRTVYTKTCPYCGKVFETIVSSQVYCSSTCGARDYGDQIKVEHLCECCGGEIVSDHPGRRRFCSRECAFNAKKIDCLEIKQGRDQEKEEERISSLTKTCPVCGEWFLAYASYQVYCSHECQYEAGLKRLRERNYENYTPKQFTCKECGTEVLTHFGDSRRNFCSVRCRERYFGRIYKKNRGILLKNAFVDNVELWPVYNQCEGICQICGLPVPDTNASDNQWAATIDHIIPLTLGGKRSYDNCQLAHRLCNSIKDRDLGDFEIDWFQMCRDDPDRWQDQFNDLIDQLRAESEQAS